MPSITDLENRIEAIDRELEGLARFTMRTGAGAIGFRSWLSHDEPETHEWVQIHLDEPTPIDRIVIVPSIWRGTAGTSSGMNADGFPVEFRLISGTEADPGGTVLASFSREDDLLPRIAPLIISCSTTASWVRLEADVLSPRHIDGQYNLELAEIMLFNGEENVALHRPVSSPFSKTRVTEKWAHRRAFLVDGFVPYQMDSDVGQQSRAYMYDHHLFAPMPSLTLDLGSVHPVNRIHLHAVEIHDTVPSSDYSGYAMPEELLIEGSLRADFAEASPLWRYQKKSIYHSGPVLMERFPATRCRYIRLTVLEPSLNPVLGPGPIEWRTGFAEIEVFANGLNRALHQPVTGRVFAEKGRPLNLLTDGSNLHGRILPQREWMEQLARRHDLERERPLLAARLQQRYDMQKVRLQQLSWTVALLLAGIVFTILIDRMIRMRQAARLKERFAADLHDELGANLHTIGLLGDLAVKKSGDLPENLAALVQRMSAVARRSVKAVQHVTDLQNAEGLYTGLVADMRRAAERIVVELHHDFSVEGEPFLAQLNPRDQIDLFLYYKECLINCCRHAGATELSTRLEATADRLRLTVTDNGSGLPEEEPAALPASLRRRAKFLRARITRSQPEAGGSSITLTMRTRKHKRFPRQSTHRIAS